MSDTIQKTATPKRDSTLSQLSQERATEFNAIQIPQITLPKGGSALKGIDEKFQVNPINSTSSFSIPLPLSPNRNGFTPQLSLSYNSGVGNSLFGIRWDVDFNYGKGSSFTPSTPALPVINFTYDIYSVSGQAVSGSYRLFRSDLASYELKVKPILNPVGSKITDTKFLESKLLKR